MIRSAVSKVVWVGRATVFLVGLAVVLALVLGLASAAFGADGRPFVLGKENLASSLSTLVKQGPGAALSLVVEQGQPPLKVNSSEKVASLNADKVDGLDSTQLAGFGETAYKFNEKVDGCSEKELVSKTFSVPQPTQVYASAVAFYNINGSDGTLADMKLRLLDASSGATLASAGYMFASVDDGVSGSAIPISLQGVLHSGGYAYSGSGTTPFVATPGTQYKLSVTGINSSRTCPATEPLAKFERLAVTYQLIGTR